MTTYILTSPAFEADTDYFAEKVRKIGVGRQEVNYLLTLDMAKELAMLERNEIGRAIRRYFIKKIKE